MPPTPGAIRTRHPAGKQGVRISRQKYDQMKRFILRTLKARGAMTYAALNRLAVRQLARTFDGSVPWYLVTVKLDLEARKLIRREEGTGSHTLRLSRKGVSRGGRK